MAIAGLRAKVFSRGGGHSAVGAAAYRARCVLTDERTGETHDYTPHRSKCLFEGIYAPKDAPEWAHDRAKLWNHVEAFERHRRAELAREVEISLPHELTLEQNRYLLQDWIKENVTRKGLIADATMHMPNQSGDRRNIHAHVMIVMRPLDGSEFIRAKPRFDTLTEKEAAKREDLMHMRASWEKLANRHLARHGHEARIDMGRLENAEPTVHLGKHAAAMERRGVETDRGDHNREAANQNEARARLAEVEAERQALQAKLQAQEQAAMERDHQAQTGNQPTPEEDLKRSPTPADLRRHFAEKDLSREPEPDPEKQWVRDAAEALRKALDPKEPPAFRAFPDHAERFKETIADQKTQQASDLAAENERQRAKQANEAARQARDQADRLERDRMKENARPQGRETPAGTTPQPENRKAEGFRPHVEPPQQRQQEANRRAERSAGTEARQEPPKPAQAPENDPVRILWDLLEKARVKLSELGQRFEAAFQRFKDRQPESPAPEPPGKTPEEGRRAWADLLREASRQERTAVPEPKPAPHRDHRSPEPSRDWKQERGGIGDLSGDQQDRARASYDRWKEARPGQSSFDFGSYVAFVQRQEAKRAAERGNDQAAAPRRSVSDEMLSKARDDLAAERVKETPQQRAEREHRQPSRRSDGGRERYKHKQRPFIDEPRPYRPPFPRNRH